MSQTKKLKQEAPKGWRKDDPEPKDIVKEKYEIPNEDFKVARCEPQDQIIHFVNGYKRTIFNVQYIWEKEMIHIVDAQGIEWIINKPNVLCIEKIRRNL